MKNVAIIIPYFGKIPNNIVTFLESCRINTKIDWLIFTDQNFKKFDVPLNVHIINENFETVKKRIRDAVNLDNIILDEPYKLCDYKPTYGIAFKDFLSEYRYWGYSDIDVVYGDLWKFIQLGIEKGYDRIGHLGHFTLFRNSKEVNNRYVLPINKNGKHQYLYKNVFKTPNICHFDEAWGMSLIYDQYNFSTYENKNLVNEPYPENMDLISIDKQFLRLPQLYLYRNGKCIFLYEKGKKINEIEYGYFHFQKRLFVNYLSKPCDNFYVDTSGYHILSDFKSPLLSELVKNKSPFFKRLSYMMYTYHRTNWFTDRKLFNYYIPIKHIYNRIFREHDFFV